MGALTVLALLRLSMASLTLAVSASTLSTEDRRAVERGEEEAGGTARSAVDVRSTRRGAG